MEYWPASPKTVADYLRQLVQGPRHKSLQMVRSAISTTHREAGWDNPFKTSLVAGTFEELMEATGERRRHSMNISGRILLPADHDAIRSATSSRRLHGAGMQSLDYASRRGQEDLALCSVVLESGLLCGEAEALEWKDLKPGTDDKATITVKTRRAGGCTTVELSKRAHEDLKAIKPANAGENQKIFALSARQIATRVRAAAADGGLEGRIEGDWRGKSTWAAATGASRGADSVPVSHWQAFCTWCDQSGAEKLPARAETVSRYLNEMSALTGMAAINNSREAIADAHREAEFDDPCVTDLVTATLLGIRRRGPMPTAGSLDSYVVEAIRATALKPRLYAYGREPEKKALARGQIDIALCSVLHAGRLSVAEAVALKWRDVENTGDDRLELTIREKTELQSAEEVREITGQAVRDLEAIRRDAKPEGRVFGFGRSAVIRRLKAAAMAAGFGQPTDPGSPPASAAGPSHTATPGPSSSATPGSSLTAGAGPPRTSA